MCQSGTSESWVVEMYDDDLSLGSDDVAGDTLSSASYLVLVPFPCRMTDIEAQGCQFQRSAAFSDLRRMDPSTVGREHERCRYEESELQGESSQNFLPVTVYNSLGWSVKKFVSVPAFRDDVEVRDSDGQVMPFQVNPAIPSHPSPCLSPGTCGYANTTGDHYSFSPALKFSR